MRKIGYFLCMLSSFYFTTAKANNGFLGVGSGLDVITRNGNFTQSDGTYSLSATPHSTIFHPPGNAIAGYEWKMTPQFFLSTEIFGEFPFSHSDSTFQFQDNEKNISLTTTQYNKRGYGFLMQPGLYSERFHSQFFFNFGFVRSEFTTQYKENITKNSNTSFYSISQSHWSNGIRWGIGETFPIAPFPTVFNQMNLLFTHYTAWSMCDSQIGLCGREKPTSMQITWNVIWKIDAGDHEISKAVIHHGLLYYLKNPDQLGKESEDVTKSPF